MYACWLPSTPGACLRFFSRSRKKKRPWTPLKWFVWILGKIRARKDLAVRDLARETLILKTDNASLKNLKARKDSAPTEKRLAAQAGAWTSWTCKEKQEINLLIHFTPGPRVPELLARRHCAQNADINYGSFICSGEPPPPPPPPPRRLFRDDNDKRAAGLGEARGGAHGIGLQSDTRCESTVDKDATADCVSARYLRACSIINYLATRLPRTRDVRESRSHVIDSRRCRIDDARFEIIYCGIVASRTPARHRWCRDNGMKSRNTALASSWRSPIRGEHFGAMLGIAD